eukprot:scaffold112272_cov32-Tisochrysis_lutea.AAC.3
MSQGPKLRCAVSRCHPLITAQASFHSDNNHSLGTILELHISLSAPASPIRSTSTITITGKTCWVRNPLTSRLATCQRLRKSTSSCARLLAARPVLAVGLLLACDASIAILSSCTRRTMLGLRRRAPDESRDAHGEGDSSFGLLGRLSNLNLTESGRAATTGSTVAVCILEGIEAI